MKGNVIDGYSRYSNDVPRGEKARLIETSYPNAGRIDGSVRQHHNGRGLLDNVQEEKGRTTQTNGTSQPNPTLKERYPKI